MPTSVEAQPIYVPKTPRGSYAGFAGQPRPKELAQNLGLPVESRANAQMGIILRALYWLEKSPYPSLTPEMLEKFQAIAQKLQLHFEDLPAAEAGKDTFGEVKAKGEEALPLLVVAAALRHNVAEARTRLMEEAGLMSELVFSISSAIQSEIGKIRGELEQQKRSQETKVEAAAKVRTNQNSGYAVNREHSEETYNHIQGMILFDQQRNRGLKEELEELELLQKQLSLVLLTLPRI